MAVKKGNKDIIKLLLNNPKIDVDKRDDVFIDFFKSNSKYRF